MRIVWVPMLAGFTVGAIVDCIQVSCFLWSENVGKCIGGGEGSFGGCSCTSFYILLGISGLQGGWLEC